MSCFSLHTNSTTVAEPDPTKHVNFNVGMVLGVDDFTQEFAYLAGRDQWMARDLIGYGTVRGLNVRIEVDATKGPRVAVEPGVAVSPRGQMICVPAAQCAYLRNWVTDHADEIGPIIGSPPDSPPGASLLLYVVLCYRNCPTDNVPIAGEPCRSEDKLMAPSRLMDDFSLELRLEKPNQREENAVRDFVAWLKQVPVSDDPSTPLDQFLQAIRDAAAEWLASPLSSPLTSPPGDFMFGSPPESLNINTADVTDYLRAAFRVWVTELRPRWIARWHGCVATHFDFDKQVDENCVLLAELEVPLLPLSPGSWDIPDAPIPVNQDERPFLVHLRLLQEWLLAGISAAAAGDGGFVELALPPPESLNVLNVEGPVTMALTEEDCVICNTTAGIVRVTLPLAAENDGRVMIVKRISTGSQVQIAADAGETVEGQGQVLLTAQNRFFQLVANAKLSGWHVIAQ
ncbi:MAG TPA: hypothetical protein VK893_03360 [Pyrinomonadaceae bacterium]|nr:hypothetical protein [Pyrinomonadaceae bacterium]